MFFFLFLKTKWEEAEEKTIALGMKGRKQNKDELTDGRPTQKIVAVTDTER